MPRYVPGKPIPLHELLGKKPAVSAADFAEAEAFLNREAEKCAGAGLSWVRGPDPGPGHGSQTWARSPGSGSWVRSGSEPDAGTYSRKQFVIDSEKESLRRYRVRQRLERIKRVGSPLDLEAAKEEKESLAEYAKEVIEHMDEERS